MPTPGRGRGAMYRARIDVCFRPSFFQGFARQGFAQQHFAGHFPRPLAGQPALSVALHHRAVLGRQRHRRPSCRRPYSPRDAVVPALVACVSAHPSLCLEAPRARLARDPLPARPDDDPFRHRHRHLQHPAVLGARTYPGAQYAVAAVRGSPDRRGVVADPARRAADAGAGDRRPGVADGRAGDPAARRPDRAFEDPVQQGRPHLHRRAGLFRALFGADAEAPRGSRPVVCRLHFRLRRGVPHSALDLGIDLPPGHGARCEEPPEPVLRRGVSLDGGLSLLQSRRAVDRRQPRGAFLSCRARVRRGDGNRLPRRAPAAFPCHRLRAGADGRLRRVPQAGHLIHKREDGRTAWHQSVWRSCRNRCFRHKLRGDIRESEPSALPAASSSHSPLRWLSNQPYLLLSLTSLFWAGNIVLGRYVAGHVPPMTLSCVRWIGAFLILLPFAWGHLKRDWLALRAHLALMVVLSATGFAINNALSYWALQHTQALNALLIQSSGPLFVALWSLLLFGLRLTWAQLAGIAISLAGVLTIVLRGDFSALASIQFNKGDVMFAAALLVFGLYSALMLRRPKMHSCR